MRVTFYMNCVSAHQLPLAREVQRLVGTEDFAYVDAGEVAQKMQTLEQVEGMRVLRKGASETEDWLNEADVVLTGLRDLDLLEARARRGKRTFYYSERWFKPIPYCEKLVAGGWSLPGWVRMLVPRYRRMVKRFVAWANGDSGARVLAVGPWARKDFLRMGVKAERIVDWGYFVAPSTFSSPSPTLSTSRSTLRVLWVGRMLGWKRVDTIIKAVARCTDIELTLVGDGSEKKALVNMAQELSVTFRDSMSIDEIRTLMREHDVYVLASDANEGWGAALNEAMEEGMVCVGTHEAGASAAMLPESNRFSAGDWVALERLLHLAAVGELPRVPIGEWTAAKAAERLLELCK